MILKIYLVVSVLTFIVFLLTNLSLKNTIEHKTKKILEKSNKDIAGTINAYLKLFIICFTPLVNLFFLFIVLFCGNEIKKRVDKITDDIIEKK